MAFTYAGQYTEALLATGSSGATLLPSLAVNVYTVGTSTAVTLYTSRTKGTTTANPVSTDANGNLTFFADPGQYDIVFTPPGGSAKRVTVSLPVDAAESGTSSTTLAALTDVTPGAPTYGTELVYDPATSKWKAGGGPKFYADLDLYLPSATAFDLWKAGLARSRSQEGVARLHFYGDSLTNSFRCLTPYETWAYPELIRAKMAASGLYGPVTEGPIWGTMTSDSRVTVPTGWNSGWSTMPGGGPGAFWVDGGATASDFTFGPVTCDRFHTYWYQRSDSPTTIRATIDGGSAINATVTAPGTANFQKVTYIAGSTGSHTLAVQKPPQGAGFKQFLCAVEYGTGPETSVGTTRALAQASTNRTGVAVSRAGVNGTTTTSWSTYVSGTLDGGYDICAPDLTVLFLGTNDINNAISTATYKTNLATIIGRARARNGDVLLVSPHKSNVTNISQLPNYQAVLYQLCDEQNVGLFDLGSRWPAYATSQNEPYGYTTAADGSHPNQRGYSDIANGVFDALRRISGY